MSQTKILDPVLRSIAKAYNQQLEQYLAMDRLAEEQKKSIEAGEFEKLEEIIRSRQEIIESIEVSNQELLPLKEDIKTALGLKNFSIKRILQELPSVGAEELNLVLGEIARTIISIKQLDQENERLLMEQLEKVKIELKGIQGKKKVSKAYGSYAKQQDASFFDTSK